MKKLILVGLDRDGTINVDNGYFGKEDDWKRKLVIYNNVAEGIRLLKSDPRFKVIVATNQAGVARGFYGVERIEEVNREIDRRLRLDGAVIDSWQYCPFVDEEYARKRDLAEDNPWIKNTDMRKPGIGMLRKATEEMGLRLEDFADIYFLGNTTGDVKTGLNANGKGILILNGENEDKCILINIMRKKPEYKERAFIANNLLSAAQIIMEKTRR